MDTKGRRLAKITKVEIFAVYPNLVIKVLVNAMHSGRSPHPWDMNVF